MASSENGCISVECMASHKSRTPLESWSYDIDAVCPPGQIDMCITHCGICGSDIHQLDDNWGGAKFPLVPGHEIIGKIVAVGEGVTNVQVSHVLGEGGDRCTLCLCLCDARRAAFDL
jgi:uncharacterized zinc-type alcohol dehydrogenase-like protein